MPSPCGNRNALAGCRHQSRDVPRIGRQNLSISGERKLDDGGIDDVGCPCLPEQCTRAMRAALIEAHDLTASKKAAKLRLLGRSTHLCHDVGWHQRNDAGREADSMLCPGRPIVSVRCDQDPRVVYGPLHAGLPLRSAARLRGKDARTRAVELPLRKGAVFGLPFGDCCKPVSQQKSAPRGRRHPSGDARMLGLGSAHDLRVHVAVYRDGELQRRRSSRHSQCILPR